ncbi:oxygenase MpaB family protein [Amycolatopsis sacchari]|uniref:oxygenase MpaB family protein n=1 Tax=Amycolatopsis sacchari TaxID=115433 RepID=UPI003D71506C
MHRYAWLARIAGLDPVADAREIHRISAGIEFPWDYLRSLELALLRTSCVPAISALLAATREFERRPQQRYDDTALLMAEIAEHGYDSERGREALRVVNRVHGRYAIANEDMLYVLSTFVYEPIDWITRYGWRPPHPHEKLAAYHYYTEVGRRMGIRGIPGSYDEFREFKQRYERERFACGDTNAAIAKYTLDLFASWYPRPLRGFAKAGVRSLLDRPMLDAFGLPPAPAWLTRAARRALLARAWVVRLLPPRRRSTLTRYGPRLSYPGYPEGYRPGQLGAGPPPEDLDPAFLARRGEGSGAR